MFREFWRQGLLEYDELRGIEWEWLAVDGAQTKAPLGGGKNRPQPPDRAKRGTKRRLLTEGGGMPLSVVVDGANRHDMKLLRPTLHQMPLRYPPLARQSVNVCLDKGYDYDEIRESLRHAGFIPRVRSRGEEKAMFAHDPRNPARRWVVERTHG